MPPPHIHPLRAHGVCCAPALRAHVRCSGARRGSSGGCLGALRGEGGGGVWQASVNSKVETVEELKGRRKTLHLGMLRLGREDLVLALQAALDDYAVPAYPPSVDVLRMELILTPSDRLISIAAPPALIPPSLALSCRLLLHPAFRLIRLILIAPLFSPS